MNLTKEEKKKMKGLKLVSTSYEKRVFVKIPRRLDEKISHLCKKNRINKQNFIDDAIFRELEKVRNQ